MLALLNELRAEASEVVVGRTVAIAAARRLAVHLTFRLPDGGENSLWALLASQPDTGIVTLVNRSWVGSIATLVQGVEPSWPIDAPAAARYSDDDAREILQAAISEALSERTGGADDFGGRVAGLLMELFEGDLESSSPDEVPDENVVDLEGERRKRGEPARTQTSAEQRIQSELTAAFNDYLQSDRMDDELSTSDLRLDSAFMKEHGGPLMARMVSAFAGAILPKDFALELPLPGASTDEADGDGEASTPTVSIDVGDLLRGFFEPPSDDAN